MRRYALDLWSGAVETLNVAQQLLGQSNDSAASRAYYAAFYAVSALFALENQTFTKHSALEIAVHRDLVKTGRWPEDLGKAYSRLWNLRQKGDYGGDRHVSTAEAEESVEHAASILAQVRQEYPKEFP